MALTKRIESLRQRHGELEATLGREEQRMWHDESKIIRLKMQKLRVKDEIARLSVVSETGPPA